MNLSDAAKAFGTQVLEEVTAAGHEVGPELHARAEACAQMAAQILVDQLEGASNNPDLDAEIVAARFQALRAAGSVALAGAIIDTIRSTALKGLALIATL